jgi:hypothetical protein
MELRIPKAVTNLIPIGRYKLVAQIENDNLGFTKEIQDSLTVQKQGIPG